MPDRDCYAVPLPSGSTLVEILQSEGEFDAAWTAAQEFGCRDQLWLDLAKRRESIDAMGAIAVYKREIARVLGSGRPSLYPDAMALVGRVCALFVENGRRGESNDYLTEVRFEFGRKRSFIKLLDAPALIRSKLPSRAVAERGDGR